MNIKDSDEPQICTVSPDLSENTCMITAAPLLLVAHLEHVGIRGMVHN